MKVQTIGTKVTVLQLAENYRDRLFESFERAIEKGGYPNESQYAPVYAGYVAGKNVDLEELFVVFNVRRPESYKGHSLSVSDVIVLGEGTEKRAYYVDSFGFKRLDERFFESDADVDFLKGVKFYFDMDGVLAKWDTNDSVEDTFQPGYFFARKPEEEVVALIQRMNRAGLNVNILTAVYQNGHAAEEKAMWLKKYGIENNAIMVPYGEKKSDYIPKDGLNILLDDYSKNLSEWVENPNNVGVKFFNGINGNYGTWKGYALSVAQGAEAMANTLIGIAMVEQARRTN